MKKILITFGVISILIVAACETPQPTTDPNSGDTTTNMNNSGTQSDSVTNRPDSMPKP
jgi:hypothetical protein